MCVNLLLGQFKCLNIKFTAEKVVYAILHFCKFLVVNCNCLPLYGWSVQCSTFAYHFPDVKNKMLPSLLVLPSVVSNLKHVTGQNFWSQSENVSSLDIKKPWIYTKTSTLPRQKVRQLRETQD